MFSEDFEKVNDYFHVGVISAKFVENSMNFLEFSLTHFFGY